MSWRVLTSVRIRLYLHPSLSPKRLVDFAPDIGLAEPDVAEHPLVQRGELPAAVAALAPFPQPVQAARQHAPRPLPRYAAAKRSRHSAGPTSRCRNK